MASQEPSPRIALSGYESVFGKAKGMVFPRIFLVGHGVLDELATTCRQFGFPNRGAVVTGPKTAEIAGRRGATILQEGGFHVTTVIAHEANEPEVDRVAEEVRASGPSSWSVPEGGARSTSPRSSPPACTSRFSVYRRRPRTTESRRRVRRCTERPRSRARRGRSRSA